MKVMMMNLKVLVKNSVLVNLGSVLRRWKDRGEKRKRGKQNKMQDDA